MKPENWGLVSSSVKWGCTPLTGLLQGMKTITHEALGLALGTQKPPHGQTQCHGGAPHTSGSRMEGRSSKITSHQEREQKHEIRPKNTSFLSLTSPGSSLT